MGRKEITQKLTKLLEKHINPYNDTRIYSAKEVTFDYSSLHPIRVDYMVFKPADQTTGGIEKGNFYCYEIKSCQADFNSGHGLNFIGDFNYLVIPQGLYMEIEKSVPYYVGVYEENNGELKCVKKAKQRNRCRSVNEMLLMMFRSSNRELINIEKDKKKRKLHRYGHWELDKNNYVYHYVCSECKSSSTNKMNFCGNCGAEMDNPEE